MTKSSKTLFAEAQKVTPGGVNSPVRACISVDAEPLFIATAKGSTITTVEGETFVDYVQSWGPLLLGHSHPAVAEALHTAVERGTTYGAPCEDEVVLAQMVTQAMPAVEMVRFVNSGTEATMSAVRLARAFTGRDKIVKFIGGYHGHSDGFLVSAGSGVATLSIPGTPGVPATIVEFTLQAPYNDLAAVQELFAQQADDIAAIIVEPAAGNMGLIPPLPGFLQGLRDLCTKHGSLLIFDEVITGFRAGYGGAQGRFGVTPDLTTLGKIIGGGLPVGAYGGRRDIMKRIAPSGDVYQAGTLSGNPLAMAAGIATLKELKKADYAGLEARVSKHCEALRAIFAQKGIAATVNSLASMFTLFFTEGPVENFADSQRSDNNRYTRYFKHMRAQGIFIAPSSFEVSMVSFAHSDADLAAMQKAAESFAG